MVRQEAHVVVQEHRRSPTGRAASQQALFPAAHVELIVLFCLHEKLGVDISQSLPVRRGGCHQHGMQLAPDLVNLLTDPTGTLARMPYAAAFWNASESLVAGGRLGVLTSSGQPLMAA